MSAALKQIKSSAAKLSASEKEALIEFLIQSLDEPKDPDAEQAWAEELQKRNSEFESGAAVLKSAAQSLKEAREQLKCRR